MKITFLGAGSTVFAKNVLGDCILTPTLGEFEIALYDLDEKRLNESYLVINNINKKYNGKATVTKHLGTPQAKLGRENFNEGLRTALTGANYVINAVQIGGYKPCTVSDFKIPARYGLRQTIADTLGVGGIFRALRTIPVMKCFADMMEEVCPDAWLLNYTNPMAMLTGYMLTHTKVKTVGLCHSVQGCIPHLLNELKMKEKYPPESVNWTIYGINHQAWLLDVKDKDGNDLYPEIRERAALASKGIIGKMGAYASGDRVRYKIMEVFGYYVTESSEHNAEYCPWFIKRWKPFWRRGALRWTNKYRVPLDEYPVRCRRQIRDWKRQAKRLESDASFINHNKSHEYGAYIIEALHTGKPFTFSGSVLNTKGYITNLPKDCCVEIPIVADKNGLTPQFCGTLPEQLAAYNMTNIGPQMLTLKANETRLMDDLIRAVAMDPHTGAVLTLDKIQKMCKALYKRHYKQGWMPEYK